MDKFGSGVFPRCYPVNLHLPKLALERPPARSTSCTPTTNGRSSMAQNAALLAEHFDLKPAHDALRQDIRETLQDLFAFTAAAEGQYLATMERLIERELQIQSTEAQTEWTLTNLRFFKSSVDEHIVHLENLMAFLGRPEVARWTANSRSASPGPREAQSPHHHLTRLISSSPTIRVYENSQFKVMSDVAHVLQHAKRLSLRCVENTTALVNMAMLEESKKAIIQADGMKRLTLLAFFFLPCSLATSFFGMNFREFGTGYLSIWVFFVFVVPLVAISSAICYWNSVSTMCLRSLAWLRRKEHK